MAPDHIHCIKDNALIWHNGFYCMPDTIVLWEEQTFYNIRSGSNFGNGVSAPRPYADPDVPAQRNDAGTWPGPTGSVLGPHDVE